MSASTTEVTQDDDDAIREGQRWSEADRHRCEVLYVRGLPDHVARARYLAAVAQHRGEAVAERLRVDIWKALRERLI